MNRDPILFRVDGTSQSGWESFWRCLTFSAALQRRRRPTWFLSRLEPGELAFAIKRVGNQWLGTNSPLGSDQDLEETIQEVRRLKPSAIVVDSEAVSESYLSALSAEGPTLVSLDHLATLRFPSRLIINPLLSASCDDYEIPLGSQVLLGARYALVRPEVRRLRPLRAQEPVQPFRALIALGDDDPNQQSVELTKQVLNCPGVEKVDILTRSHHPELEALRALADGAPEQISVNVEPQEVAAKIIRCHFAITAGNTWSLELACVGIPQLVIVQKESHWPTAQRLEEEGAATCLGWHENVSARTIRDAVQILVDDPLERQAMARCGRRLIDGRGPDRLVNGLEIMLNRSRPVELDLAA